MDPTSGEVGGDLAVTPGVVVPAADLRWRFSRASGPGGQGVNTTDSRVELGLDVAALPDTVLTEAQRARVLRRLAGRLHDGVLTVTAADDRSQLRNRRSARERLAAVLRDALAPDPVTRRPTRPSRGARRRRLDDKRRRGERKQLRQRPDRE